MEKWKRNSITIYIIIPLLMIPQMILGGAMFSFEKLNRKISSIDKVPFVAEFITTKWMYIPEIVENDKTGLLVKPRDTNELKLAMSGLQEKDYKRLSKNAYDAFKQFDSEKLTASFLRTIVEYPFG